MFANVARYIPNTSNLIAAGLAALIAGAALLWVWAGVDEQPRHMQRYGEVMALTLAQSSATHLLHRDQIELAVLANQAIVHEEITGIVFYSVNNEIIAISGVNDRFNHFTAPATIEDTITGYVSVVLDAQAFAPQGRGLRWLLSIAALVIAPLLTLAVMHFSRRGNRSLPIVSVPEPVAHDPERSYCLTVNLHNQIELTASDRERAVDDALAMAREVCAIHQGIATDVAERGVIVLFASHVVTPSQAVCAAFLVQRLLAQFETQGRYRVFLTEAIAPGRPGEITQLTHTDLTDTLGIDDALLLAALARPDSVLLSSDVFEQLSERDRSWATAFVHPLVEDVAITDPLYIVTELPEPQETLVNNQVELILGFQATA